MRQLSRKWTENELLKLKALIAGGASANRASVVLQRTTNLIPEGQGIGIRHTVSARQGAFI